MLSRALRTVLERAASEAAFRDSLLRDLDSTLAAFKLSDEEAAMVTGINREQLERLAKDMSGLEGELSEEMLEAVVGGQRRMSMGADCG